MANVNCDFRVQSKGFEKINSMETDFAEVVFESMRFLRVDNSGSAVLC